MTNERTFLCLLRGLMRCAKKLDNRPALRAFLQIEKASSVSSTTPLKRRGALESLRIWMGGGQYYLPTLPSPRSATDTVLYEWRKALRDANKGKQDIDGAFAVLKTLRESIHTSEVNNTKGNDNDDNDAWKDKSLPHQRSGLDLPKVRHTLKLERGNLLLAHPLLRCCFRRSVILIVDNDETGSSGFIVNKISYDGIDGRFSRVSSLWSKILKFASRYVVRYTTSFGRRRRSGLTKVKARLRGNRSRREMTKVFDTLRQRPESWGGPAYDALSCILHTLPNVFPGSQQEVLPGTGVYAGGIHAKEYGNFNSSGKAFTQLLEEELEEEKKGKEGEERQEVMKAPHHSLSGSDGLVASQLKCFNGCSVWSEGQLERELDDGTWIMVKMEDKEHAQTFLRSLISDKLFQHLEGRQLEDIRDLVWSSFLSQMGGEYAALSSIPFVEEDDYDLEGNPSTNPLHLL